MLRHSIVAYRRLPDVDVENELRGLGLPIAGDFLVFWQEVVAGRRDHWTFPTFTTYSGVPIYLIEERRRFAVYAVFDEPDDGITITVMLAARYGDASVGRHVWDGTDMTFIRDCVLQPRLADYLHIQRKPVP